MTDRQKILEVARDLRNRGLTPFAPIDVLRELERRGTTYSESTIRTHTVSVMCTNAPENHIARYDDLVRVGRGRYQLVGRP